MSDNTSPTGSDPDPVVALRARAADLERRLADIEQDARARVVRAELKVEAVRAGIVDLDGLKLLEPGNVQVGENGELTNAAELMAQFKRSKPWLFGNPSSSSQATPPPAQPPRHKLATEMTSDEYRAARAAILKHHP